MVVVGAVREGFEVGVMREGSVGFEVGAVREDLVGFGAVLVEAVLAVQQCPI